jgi:hypothetical protein
MRYILSRSAFFVLGFIVTGTVFDLIHSTLATGSPGSRGTAYDFFTHLTVALILSPFAAASFWLTQRFLVNVAQAGLLGALYFAALAATFTSFSSLQLGQAAGVSYLVLLGLAVVYGGGVAIGWRRAHG